MVCSPPGRGTLDCGGLADTFVSQCVGSKLGKCKNLQEASRAAVQISGLVVTCSSDSRFVLVLQLL